MITYRVKLCSMKIPSESARQHLSFSHENFHNCALRFSMERAFDRPLHSENFSERVCRMSIALCGLVASTPHSRRESAYAVIEVQCGLVASTLYRRRVSTYAVREVQCGLVTSTLHRRRVRENAHPSSSSLNLSPKH